MDEPDTRTPAPDKSPEAHDATPQPTQQGADLPAEVRSINQGADSSAVARSIHQEADPSAEARSIHQEADPSAVARTINQEADPSAVARSIHQKADSSAVARSAKADLPFLIAHPAHWLALGLGSGLLRPGPGTWGTLLAWLLFVAIAPDGATDPATGLIVVAVALVIGTWAAGRAAAMLGEADPGTIVVDEIVAFWLVLVMLPAGPHLARWQALAFVLFRFFDIVKPPPIRQIDRRMKNAVGVMVDDLVAALYTLIVIALAVRLGF